jgi:hypothetical protein
VNHPVVVNGSSLKVDHLLLHIPLFKFQLFSISFSTPHIIMFRIKIHNLNMTKRISRLIDDEVDVSGDVRRDSDVDSELDDDAGSLVDFVANDDEFETVVDSIFGDSSEDEYTPQITSNSGRRRSNTTTSGLLSPPTKTITPAAARKIAAQLQKDALNAFKPPGDSSYPTNDFSLTITRTGVDVGLDSLDSIGTFIEQHCIKGGVSTEVGQRAFLLHLVL